MDYVWFGLIALAVSFAVTPLVRKLARATGAMDIPRPPRNLHAKPTPKLGGLAVVAGCAVAIGLYLQFGNWNSVVVPPSFFLGIGAGALILMIGGFLDDKYDLPPYLLWIFPSLAALVVVLSGVGVGITTLSNPFGEPFNLNFKILFLPASAIFAWVWLMGMMFTTKFLDGLDGLVAGIGTIASFTLFLLSLTQTVNQPVTATLAIILCGALLGYLFYAFHPASIFIGDGGSLFVGFMLGSLSILLGGKIATAFLVMGIPILDVALVLLQRILTGRSPFKGDRLHLHFRLLDAGFTQRQTALIFYSISALFGFSAVFLQSLGKLIALVILFMVMALLVGGTVYLYRRKNRINQGID
ncbi:MAG: undecaprenyl/decaprenyl-phosphate alpha-N-acetylglucosaminyl 1-phosphate transferase [Candidatus Doudnabacteria bacterium]|nr:undecaprenyl/decaprenyl-phosphate alpha-N-acetylglucosaminyl 1-phosphate transferase [Candidatus Doudnabacteria bacterium]